VSQPLGWIARASGARLSRTLPENCVLTLLSLSPCTRVCVCVRVRICVRVRACACCACSWRGPKGGTVQFLAAEDSFVFTKVGLGPPPKDGAASQPVLSSWTAVRRGAPSKPRAAGGDGKRSMLSRYGWYVGIAIMYVAYKAATAKAAAMVGGAAKKTK
jgi:hypothetical protein